MGFYVYREHLIRQGGSEAQYLYFAMCHAPLSPVSPVFKNPESCALWLKEQEIEKPGSTANLDLFTLRTAQIAREEGGEINLRWREEL